MNDVSLAGTCRPDGRGSSAVPWVNLSLLCDLEESDRVTERTLTMVVIVIVVAVVFTLEDNSGKDVGPSRISFS